MPNYILEHIDIEINHRCNLSCRHCSAQARKGIQPKDELSTSEIEKILSDAKEQGLKKVGLTGGEPLFDLEKLRIITRFCIDKLKLPLHIHTNGYLLTKEICAKDGILSAFESISITFLGGRAEIHDRMTATKGSFDRAFKGAQLLSENNLPLVCYFIPTHDTCESFENLVTKLYNIGVKRIRAMSLAPSGRARRIYDETAPLKEEMKKFEEILLKMRMKCDIEIEAGYCTRLSMPGLSVLNGHEKCMSAKNRVHINSKGDVFPCTAASGVKELCLGNLKENGFSLSDIWNKSELINRIRLAHSGLLHQCNHCQHKERCRFGCTVNTLGTMTKAEQLTCPLSNLKLSISSNCLAA